MIFLLKAFSLNSKKSESIFDQNEALSKILKREDNWAKAKNMINNKKTDDPERVSHFDLTIFISLLYYFHLTFDFIFILFSFHFQFILILLFFF